MIEFSSSCRSDNPGRKGSQGCITAFLQATTACGPRCPKEAITETAPTGRDQEHQQRSISAIHPRAAAIGPLAIWRDSTADGSTAGSRRKKNTRRLESHWKSIVNCSQSTPHFAELRSPAHENEALRIGTSRRGLGVWPPGRFGDQSWRCQGLAGQRALAAGGPAVHSPRCWGAAAGAEPPDWTPDCSAAQRSHRPGAAPIPQSCPHCRLGGTGGHESRLTESTAQDGAVVITWCSVLYADASRGIRRQFEGANGMSSRDTETSLAAVMRGVLP